MGYVGNKYGPRKSDIVSKLGTAYFGISDEELATEVDSYIEEEDRGEIDPVSIDEDGEPYLVFYAPGEVLQRFYLRKYGYEITGQVKAIVDGKVKEINL